MSSLTQKDSRPPDRAAGWQDWPLAARQPADGHSVPVEDYLRDGEYVLRAELPGVDPERDIEVTVTRDILTIRAEHEIHETMMGSVAQAVVEVADQDDARMIIVGSRRPTDLPPITIGSVSNKLLHLAKRPVLVVPHHHGASKQPEASGQDQTAQPVTG
jgi:nucleotide-binding universal stress UspA family protein